MLREARIKGKSLYAILIIGVVLELLMCLFPEWIAVFGVVVLGAFLVAKFDTFGILLIIAFLLPMGAYLPFLWGGEGTSMIAIKALIVILFFMKLTKMLAFSDLKMRFTPLIMPLMAFVVISFFSCGFMDGDFWELSSIVGYSLLPIIILMEINSPEKLWQFVTVLVVSGFLVLVYSMVMNVTGFGVEVVSTWVIGGRFLTASTFGHVNNLAQYFLFLIPLTFAVAYTRKTAWHRLAYFLLVLLFSVMVLFTFSRGAIIGLGVTYLCLLAFLRWRNVWRYGLVLAAVTGLLLLRLPVLLIKFTQFTTAYVPRLILWEAGLKMFATHPMIGIGPGNFRHSVLKFSEGWLMSTGAFPAHNVWVKVLAETGILGFGVFLVWILMIIKAGFRGSLEVERQEWLIFRCCLIGFAIFLVLGSSVISNSLIFFPFWMAIGILSCGERFFGYRHETSRDQLPTVFDHFDTETGLSGGPLLEPE